MAGEMARLTAGVASAGFRVTLALVGDDGTGNLAGERVSIFAKRYHILERLIVKVATEKGAAVGVGIVIGKLLDERVGGVR